MTVRIQGETMAAGVGIAALSPVISLSLVRKGTIGFRAEDGDLVPAGA